MAYLPKFAPLVARTAHGLISEYFCWDQALGREVIRVMGDNQESGIGPEVLRFIIRMKLDVSSSVSSKLNFGVRTVGPCVWIETTRKDLAKKGLTLRMEEFKG